MEKKDLTDSNIAEVRAATTENLYGYIVRRYVRIERGEKPRNVIEVVKSNRKFGDIDIFVQPKLDEKFHATEEFEFRINNGAWDLNLHDAEEQMYKYVAAVMCVRELARTQWRKVPLVYVKNDD